MKCTTSFDEFCFYTTFSDKQDDYNIIIRDHPDFGKWEQRSIDLSHIRIHEHKATLKREIAVACSANDMGDVVNHCMCIDGSLGTHFRENSIQAALKPRNYHYLTADENEYTLNMSKSFHNIHVEISRDHYANLLCDSEEWSATLKEKILDHKVCYPGEFGLTPAMVKIICDVYSNPVTGSLKKILIEAKIHELIALQLNNSRTDAGNKTVRKNKDLFYEIHGHLKNTFLEEHSLKSICRKFGVNEFELKKGFKELFQTTIFEFLLSQRLEYARDLLLNTNLSIKETSSRIGYKYPHHFSTAFKNKFGVSPNKFSH